MPAPLCYGRAGDIEEMTEPVWQPLLDAVGEHLTATFMWMYATTLDGGRVVHAYKHIHTRRYLFLGEDGRAYEWARCERYVPTRLDFAIEAALCSWWLFDSIEDEDAAAIRAAYNRANERAAQA